MTIFIDWIRNYTYLCKFLEFKLTRHGHHFGPKSYDFSVPIIRLKNYNVKIFGVILAAKISFEHWRLNDVIFHNPIPSGFVLINLTHASILLILVMKISLSQELIQSLVAVNQKSQI